MNPSRDEFNCWHCGFRGRSLAPLMVRNSAEQREYLGDFIPGSTKAPPAPPVNSLPPGFMPLDGRDHTTEAPYKAYLRSRGIGEALWRLYRMGYSTDRQFANRVIIPSFDRHGAPNFWSARAIHKVEHQFRYVLPSGSKDVVSNEHLVDWTKPIYLVEGAFDEVALGPQALALYGTVMLPKLAVRLVEERPPMVHVCLDSDAYDLAYHLLSRLVKYDLPCSLVDLSDKDPSVMGRDAVIEAAGASKHVTGSIDLVGTRL